MGNLFKSILVNLLVICGRKFSSNHFKNGLTFVGYAGMKRNSVDAAENGEKVGKEVLWFGVAGVLLFPGGNPGGGETLA